MDKNSRSTVRRVTDDHWSMGKIPLKISKIPMLYSEMNLISSRRFQCTPWQFRKIIFELFILIINKGRIVKSITSEFLTFTLPEASVGIKAVSWAMIEFKSAAGSADATEVYAGPLMLVSWLKFAVCTSGLTDWVVLRVFEIIVFGQTGRRSAFSYCITRYFE